jgi:hypothetical protein
MTIGRSEIVIETTSETYAWHILWVISGGVLWEKYVLHFRYLSVIRALCTGRRHVEGVRV